MSSADNESIVYECSEADKSSGALRATWYRLADPRSFDGFTHARVDRSGVRFERANDGEVPLATLSGMRVAEAEAPEDDRRKIRGAWRTMRAGAVPAETPRRRRGMAGAVVAFLVLAVIAAAVYFALEAGLLPG